jgi:tryptophan synthase alpha chain
VGFGSWYGGGDGRYPPRVPKISDIFALLREQRKQALIPFICGGFPRAGDTARALVAADRAGASIIEVGIPFSDPIADGPVIAGAMHTALTRGSTPASVFAEVQSVREQVKAAIVAMVSVSIVQRAEARRAEPPGATTPAAAFCAKAKAAGFDGIIVPDVPLEESAGLIEAAAGQELSLTLLVSPTSPPARSVEIAKASTGFLYMLARSGITGERGDVPDMRPRIAAIRAVTGIPIAVGFGISTPAQVRAVCDQADGAIVGSAIVRRMQEADAAGRDAVEEAEMFIRELVAATAAG